MAKEYWKTIEEKSKEFWGKGDSILCTRVFRAPDSVCQLCGYKPIRWNHVLLNERTKEILKVGSLCVVNFRKVLEKLGSKEKLLYFEKYKKAAELLNSKYEGTAQIIPFPTSQLMEQLSKNPDKFDYKKIKSILDYTSGSDRKEDSELFGVALDIWIDRSYWVYEGLEHPEGGDSEEEIRRKIKDNIEWETKMELEDFYDADDEYTGFFEESSFDDLTPEGMGLDEIDWNSHKFD